MLSGMCLMVGTGTTLLLLTWKGLRKGVGGPPAMVPGYLRRTAGDFRRRSLSVARRGKRPFRVDQLEYEVTVVAMHRDDAPVLDRLLLALGRAGWAMTL